MAPRVRIKRLLAWTLACTAGAAVLAAGVAIGLHRAGVSRADDVCRSYRAAAIHDLGTTRFLTVLPLPDWHAARPDLKTEMGGAQAPLPDMASRRLEDGNGTLY